MCSLPRSALAVRTSAASSVPTSSRWTRSGRRASMTEVSQDPEWDPGLGPTSPRGARTATEGSDVRSSATAASRARSLPPFVDRSTTAVNPCCARPCVSSTATAVSVAALSERVPGRCRCRSEQPTRSVGASTAPNRWATPAPTVSASIASAPTGRWLPWCSIDPNGRTTVDAPPSISCWSSRALSASSSYTTPTVYRDVTVAFADPLPAKEVDEGVGEESGFFLHHVVAGVDGMALQAGGPGPPDCERVMVVQLGQVVSGAPHDQ